MEIDLNTEENTETSEFVNFSIREYVAEIRKKDWKKCWPFGSLGDPDKDEVFASYQFPEPRFLSSQNCPVDIDGSDDTPEHYTAAPNSSKVEISNGKEDRSETTADMIESLGIDNNMGKAIYDGSSESTSSKMNNAQCRHENSVNEGAKIENSVAADNDEPGRNRPRRKPQRFLLLSDILRDLAGPSGEFHVHCDIKNPGKVNSRFAAETENESDDITLDAFFRKQKGVEVTPALKKKRKTIRVEEPKLDQDKRSKPGSKDSHGNDSEFGPRSHSRKIRINDIDMQTMAKREKSSAEVRSSSSLIVPEKKGALSCLGSKENAFRKQKDCPLPCSHKSNKYEEVSRTGPTETANEDSEMEAVMLLARHFNEDENPSRPALGAKRAQTVQSSTRRNVEVESLKATKCISTSPSSCLQERSYSGGNQPAESGHDQGFASVNTSNKETGTACACVQKKIRESLTPASNESIPTLYTRTSSKTSTNDPVFYAGIHKKFTKEKLEEALCSVQMDHHREVAEHRSSCIPLKGTSARLHALVSPLSGPMVFQPQVEICMMKAAGVARDAQNCERLVCSINRNPADFSIPNAENKFMRGG